MAASNPGNPSYHDMIFLPEFTVHPILSCTKVRLLQWFGIGPHIHSLCSPAFTSLQCCMYEMSLISDLCILIFEGFLWISSYILIQSPSHFYLFIFFERERERFTWFILGFILILVLFTHKKYQHWYKTQKIGWYILNCFIYAFYQMWYLKKIYWAYDCLSSLDNMPELFMWLSNSIDSTFSTVIYEKSKMVNFLIFARKNIWYYK